MLIDDSTTGLLDDPSTVIAFAQAGSLGDISGTAAYDADLIFPDSFDRP